MSERGIDYLTGSSKRCLDVIGSSALLATTLPVGIVLGVGSAIDTKESPIFRQIRIGRNEDEFEIRKFRSIKSSDVEHNPNERGTMLSRASRFGKFMRKFGLDELPQLINVVKGDMSLVGFRPLEASDMDTIRNIDSKLFDDWVEVYKLTRPGLTGPGQLYRKQFGGEDGVEWKTAMRLDLDYAENATLLDDLEIIGKTPFKLLGAVALVQAQDELRP